MQRFVVSHPDCHYWAAGFYIHSCPKMRYKAQFAPSQLLCPVRHTWHALDACMRYLDHSRYVVFSDVLPPVVQPQQRTEEKSAQDGKPGIPQRAAPASGVDPLHYTVSADTIVTEKKRQSAPSHAEHLRCCLPSCAADAELAVCTLCSATPWWFARWPSSPCGISSRTCSARSAPERTHHPAFLTAVRDTLVSLSLLEAWRHVVWSRGCFPSPLPRSSTCWRSTSAWWVKRYTAHTRQARSLMLSSSASLIPPRVVMVQLARSMLVSVR